MGHHRRKNTRVSLPWLVLRDFVPWWFHGSERDEAGGQFGPPAGRGNRPAVRVRCSAGLVSCSR